MRLSSFSAESLERLGAYVYALVDTRMDQQDPKALFYVGKGRGQRCFTHAAAEIEWDASEPNPKLERIREIRSATGAPPGIRIVKWALDDQEAFSLEVVLIELLQTEVNRVSGHSQTGLCLSVEELDSLYANPLHARDLAATVLLVSLNGGPNSPPWPLIPDSDLAQRVLGDWGLSESRADQVEYLLGVYQGLIRCVYRVSKSNGKADHQQWPPEELREHRRQRRRRFSGERDADKEADWARRRLVDDAGKDLTKFAPKQACRFCQVCGYETLIDEESPEDLHPSSREIYQNLFSCNDDPGLTESKYDYAVSLMAMLSPEDREQVERDIRRLSLGQV